MADIRINALATTAASTASDDFVAVDGSANGTRKLNAYSPTFGGNLTVNGIGTISGAGFNVGAGARDLISLLPQAAGSGVIFATLNAAASAYTPQTWDASTFSFRQSGDPVLTITGSKLTTLSGNLTVSGTGTSSVAGNLQIGGAPNIAPSTIDRYSSVNVTNVADFPAFSLSVADGTKNVRGSMYIDSSTTQEQFAWDFSYSSTSFPQYRWKIAGNTLATLRENGNFILSSTGNDGGQKLQVSGTAAISGGIVGTTTNDNAAAGIVGEYVSSRGTSVALTSNTNTNVTSISLTAGDWDVEGSILISPSGTLTLIVAGVSSTSATYETTEDGATYLQTTFGAGQSQQLSTGARRYSLSATTTIYLIGKGAFASGTTIANGVIRARRVR